MPDVSAGQSLDAVSLWNPAFPTPDLVPETAALFDQLPPWDGHEGPRHRLTIAPGCLAVGTQDAARAERAAERQQHQQRVTADLLARYLETHGQWPDQPLPIREVTGFSDRSRARMVRALCELDYTPLLQLRRVLAMLTLTYPGDWLCVAPTGKAAKKHLRTLQWRYKRAWKEDLIGVWKLEHQRRGAPHFHILSAPPHGTAAILGRKTVGAGLPFYLWLSLVWADIVAHPEPEERAKHERAGTNIDYAEGLRARDPKRVAVYFTKHGMFAAKDYQHVVPEAWREPGKGPGRYWGYWGLEKATSTVEISPADAARVARTVRRWARAQGTTRQLTVPRTKGGQVQPAKAEINGFAGAQYADPAPTRYRRVRRRVRRLGTGRGWVSVNNGPGFASQLVRTLTPSLWETTEDRRARLIAVTGITNRRGLTDGT